jgi:hypothetical protein
MVVSSNLRRGEGLATFLLGAIPCLVWILSYKGVFLPSEFGPMHLIAAVNSAAEKANCPPIAGDKLITYLS